MKKLDVHQAITLGHVRHTVGARWKEKLRHAWETGDYSGFDSRDVPDLQGLRNTHGPAWLKGFNLDRHTEARAIRDSRKIVGSVPFHSYRTTSQTWREGGTEGI